MRAVIIIGAGIAGLSAAIALAEQGQRSVLVSALPSERAQSVMAEGGINAALDTKGQGDSVEEHFRDTIRSGGGLSDPTAVRALTEGAPALVRSLAALGVAFNRTAAGEIDLRYFGGQKKQRTAFAQSSTGKQITAALIAEARKWESRGLIARRPHHQLLELARDGAPRCAGAVVLDEYGGGMEFLPGPVLLAAGGLNGLFGKTTGTLQNTGAATAAAFAAGAACANLEMIQYHPTTTAISGKRALISEAARGEGGRLFVLRGGERWYYMEERCPELGNLMPRDVVSRETERACRETGQETAWLDMSGVSAAAFEEKLSDLRSFCREFLHLDPQSAPIPVYPGIHYFMGGVYVDEAHRATLRGLYAAGECACQYHGANRLGGNSLLGAAFGGRRAARTLLDERAQWEHAPAEEAAALSPLRAALAEIEQRAGDCSCAAAQLRLAEIMNGCMGIRRCEADLAEGERALSVLEASLRAGRDDGAGAAAQLLLERRVALAKAMVKSARARKESRGAHCRTDYPDRCDAQFQKTTVARQRGGTTAVEFAPIPKEGEPWHIG